MPMVNIQITREGTSPERDAATPEEKAALIKGASEVLLHVLNKPLDSTFVAIEEVALENWGWVVARPRTSKAAAGREEIAAVGCWLATGRDRPWPTSFCPLP